ncbi:HIT-like domain-containing protein [Myxozyma melibiosi]|uniref:HIT-like domain-containing protein n=1 Tax=Myxozyma melibiosi TaxID=54550 RepID=A0ABR1F1F7_9ASCO
MAVSLPDSFAELLRSKFEDAKKSGTLVFTDSVAEDVEVKNVSFQIRLAEGLSKKPAPSEEKSEDKTPKPKFNPFLNPDPDLLLCDLGPDYRLVLNKFSIVPYHFLCITKDFRPQSSPLSEEDLEATWACLQADSVEDGKKLMAFYNCGEVSGASQSHKHVQFIPIPEKSKLIPDVALTYGNSKSQDAIGEFPTFNPEIPFAHFVLPIPPSATAEDLVMRFSSLLARTLTALHEHGQKGIAFNFAMTKEWMFMAPRTKAFYEDVSVNATGMVGMLMAKSTEQLEFIKSTGPLEVLLGVSVPLKLEDEKHHHY